MTSCLVSGMRFGSETFVLENVPLFHFVLVVCMLFQKDERSRRKCLFWAFRSGKNEGLALENGGFNFSYFSGLMFFFPKGFKFFVEPCHDARKRMLFYDKIRQFSSTFYFDNKDFLAFLTSLIPKLSTFA